jgi:carboxylesterase type B
LFINLTIFLLILCGFLFGHTVNCGTTLAAPYFAKHGPTYAFVWNYTSPNYPDQFLQAAHGNELPYVFNGTVYTSYAFAPSDYALAARMIDAWSRIADKGKPDSSVWPKYKKNRPVAFLWEQTDANLNPPTTTVPFFESNLCSNWEPLFSANSIVQP